MLDSICNNYIDQDISKNLQIFACRTDVNKQMKLIIAFDTFGSRTVGENITG